jgi:hypothetical protein
MMGLSGLVGSVRQKTSLRRRTRSRGRGVEVLVISEVRQKVAVLLRLYVIQAGRAVLRRVWKVVAEEDLKFGERVALGTAFGGILGGKG